MEKVNKENEEVVKASNDIRDKQQKIISHLNSKINLALKNAGKVIDMGIKNFPMFLVASVGEGKRKSYTLINNNTQKTFNVERSLLKHILQNILCVEEQRYTSVVTAVYVETDKEPLVLFAHKRGRKRLPFAIMSVHHETPLETSKEVLASDLGITFPSFELKHSLERIGENNDKLVINIIKIPLGQVAARFCHGHCDFIDYVGFIKLSNADGLEFFDEEIKDKIQQKQKDETNA